MSFKKKVLKNLAKMQVENTFPKVRGDMKAYKHNVRQASKKIAKEWTKSELDGQE